MFFSAFHCWLPDSLSCLVCKESSTLTWNPPIMLTWSLLFLTFFQGSVYGFSLREILDSLISGFFFAQPNASGFHQNQDITSRQAAFSRQLQQREPCKWLRHQSNSNEGGRGIYVEGEIASQLGNQVRLEWHFHLPNCPRPGIWMPILTPPSPSEFTSNHQVLSILPPKYILNPFTSIHPH